MQALTFRKHKIIKSQTFSIYNNMELKRKDGSAMEDKDKVFSYTYSAKQQEELKRIREKYEPQKENKMEQLRRIDQSVETPPTVIALSTGIIGALIFGTGMSGVMVGSPALFILYIIVGIVGLAVAGIAYPLYLRMLKKYREKKAPEIMKLLEELKDGKE